MRTNVPLAAALLLLVILFVHSCQQGIPKKIDDRDLRDYPTGSTSHPANPVIEIEAVS